MPINAYINFNGNCREAVNFYARAFDAAPPHMITFGDMPADSSFPLPDEAKNLIAHTNLSICGSTVMFSDNFPGMPYVLGNHISLTVMTDSPEQVKTFYLRLMEGGTAEMELQKTEWSPLYASLIDQYGIGWQLNCNCGQCDQ